MATLFFSAPIACDRGTAMLFRDDVIDLEREEVELLGQVAVFADSGCACPHQTYEFSLHGRTISGEPPGS